MSVHLLKLCVGINSPDHLETRIKSRLNDQKALGKKPIITHTTRMVPKKSDELIKSGSLYWVIKGVIQARQKIINIETFQDSEGIGRCNIILSPKLVFTECQPRRAFQGWRYLYSEDAPTDLSSDMASEDINPLMKTELRKLCLI